MSKLLIVLLVVAGVIGLIIFGTVLYLNTNDVAKAKLTAIVFESIEDKGLPVELSEAYNPRINAPMFAIEGISESESMLQLKIVWPPAKQGYKVDSKIICDGGIKGSKNVTLTIDEFIDKVAVTSKELLIFSGICKDEKCLEIISDCSLSIGGGES